MMRAARSRSPAGAARADGGDAQARGGGLGQRADVDDVTVAVPGGQRRRRLAVDRQVAAPSRPRSGRRPRPRPRPAPRRGGRRASVAPCGLANVGWAVEQPRAGALEGLGEQRGAHAVAVGWARGRRAAAGGARGGERAEVGRRLDEDRLAGRGERAEGGRQRRLAARADDHVVRAEAAAGLAREPGAQLLAALDGAAVPRAGAARRAGERRAEAAGGCSSASR